MSFPFSVNIRLRSAVVIAWLGLGAASAAAAPARIALVLGNSDYYNLPATPACTASLRQVSTALARLGYQVVERRDGTSGGIAASMGQFQRAIEAAPGASAVAYFCGQAAALDQRLFVLPVSANLIRPSDVRTQGILAKAFLDLMERGHTSRALVLMDLASTEPLSETALNELAQIETSDATGLIAAVGSLDKDTPTPLATSLAERLTTPDIETGSLLKGLEGALNGAKVAKIGAMRPPLRSLALVPVADPPPPAPLTVPPPTQQTPVPEVLAKTQPIASQSRPAASFPDEAAMTLEQRRMVQIGLARFGYYGGRIDSVFGPETRAAIRQYQGEIGAEVTGTITSEQAARLLAIP